MDGSSLPWGLFLNSRLGGGGVGRGERKSEVLATKLKEFGILLCLSDQINVLMSRSSVHIALTLRKGYRVQRNSINWKRRIKKLRKTADLELVVHSFEHQKPGS